MNQNNFWKFGGKIGEKKFVIFFHVKIFMVNLKLR